VSIETCLQSSQALTRSPISNTIGVLSFRCQAILFDLDGVLVDSAECVERTWRNWASRHQLDPEHVIAFAHGRRTIETVRLVAPGLNAEAEVAELEAGEAMTTDGIHEIETARDLIERLPAGRWAIVTSGTRAVAEFRLRHTRLPIPSVMICADEIARGKPDPEGYLAAAIRLRNAPADCIVIEDAPSGIAAARAAGMRVIAIASTFPSERLTGADTVVKRLSDLSVVSDDHTIRIEIAAPRR
jgi:mannitol-1-/sugar-/sorbitol-6-phosphatase